MLKPLWIALLGLAACMAADGSLLERNGGSMAAKRGRLSIGSISSFVIKPDAGWYSFAYGMAGSLATRSFFVRNGQLLILRVQSAFCPGNTFAVYDNGEPIMNTLYGPVPNSSTQPTIDCTGGNYQDSPNTAINFDTLFSWNTAVLLPGTHNLTIVVTTSPYTGGMAFVRADTACTELGSLPQPCVGPPGWSQTILA